MRAAVAPDLAELLLLAGQWEAGTAVLRDALAELAERDPDARVVDGLVPGSDVAGVVRRHG